MAARLHRKQICMTRKIRQHLFMKSHIQVVTGHTEIALYAKLLNIFSCGVSMLFVLTIGMGMRIWEV